MEKEAKIYVAGHRGLVGSAILRTLQAQGFHNVLTRTRHELDLTQQLAVKQFFYEQKPDYVFSSAAKVGGIWANHTQRGAFIYENLMIECNLVHAAYQAGVKKLLFLGSSCIYPRDAPQPLKEEYLLSGKLEATNEPYAIAKIAGLKLCESYNIQYGTNFISVMPCNLYGTHDNFDLTSSHVLPALIRKFHEAKLNPKLQPVVLWGTGTPRREFLYVDDLAQACVFLMEKYNENQTINIGMGHDISIAELAQLVQKIVGYQGPVVWDHTKPDGTMQKLLDISRLLALGWNAQTTLENGIRQTYQWYCQNPK